MFEASQQAKRFDKGQTIEGTIVGYRAGGGVRRRRRQGRGRRRHRRAEGRRRRSSRSRSATASRRRSCRPAAALTLSRRLARAAPPPHQQLEDAFHAGPAGRGQGRAGGQGRLRSADRAPARVLPVLADRHRRAPPIPTVHVGSVYAFRIIEYKDGGTEPRRVAAEAARGGAAGAAPPSCGRRSCPARWCRAAWCRCATSAPSSISAAASRACSTSPRWAGRASADPSEMVSRRRRDHRQGAARRRRHAEDFARAQAAHGRSVVDGRRRTTTSGRSGPAASRAWRSSARSSSSSPGSKRSCRTASRASRRKATSPGPSPPAPRWTSSSSTSIRRPAHPRQPQGDSRRAGRRGAPRLHGARAGAGRRVQPARRQASRCARSAEEIATRKDVLAGLTAAAVVAPKAMAYATIAGLPVQVGLYTAIVPMAVYAALGTSRPLSVSTTTTIAILTAAALGQAAPGGSAGELIPASATLADPGRCASRAGVRGSGSGSSPTSSPNRCSPGSSPASASSSSSTRCRSFSAFTSRRPDSSGIVLAIVQHVPDTSMATLLRGVARARR